MHTAVTLVIRVVKIIVGIVVALIVLGIVFALLEANPRNGLVSAVNDIARGLVGPFEDIFQRRKAKEELAINWGIAAVVYLLIGALITALLGRVASAAYSRREREPTERTKVAERKED